MLDRIGLGCCTADFDNDGYPDLFVTGLERKDGFIPFYWDAARGRLLLEIPKLNEDLLYFAGVGKEPDGNRWNDCHYSNAFKRSKRAG